MRIIGLAIVCTLSACASGGRAREGAVDRTLDICALIAAASPHRDDPKSDEAWYWFQVERAKQSRLLWNVQGITALENRLDHVNTETDRECLRRTLREARKREVES